MCVLKYTSDLNSSSFSLVQALCSWYLVIDCIPLTSSLLIQSLYHEHNHVNSAFSKVSFQSERLDKFKFYKITLFM